MSEEYITFRTDRFSSCGDLICVKNYIDCRKLWDDDDFEMVEFDIKGRNPKFTFEKVGNYRAPNEDMRVLERLAAGTGYIGNYAKDSNVGVT